MTHLVVIVERFAEQTDKVANFLNGLCHNLNINGEVSREFPLLREIRVYDLSFHKELKNEFLKDLKPYAVPELNARANQLMELLTAAIPKLKTINFDDIKSDRQMIYNGGFMLKILAIAEYEDDFKDGKEMT